MIDLTKAATVSSDGAASTIFGSLSLTFQGFWMTHIPVPH
jgi:hypothetical protein